MTPIKFASKIEDYLISIGFVYKIRLIDNELEIYTTTIGLGMVNRFINDLDPFGSGIIKITFKDYIRCVDPLNGGITA